MVERLHLQVEGDGSRTSRILVVDDDDNVIGALASVKSFKLESSVDFHPALTVQVVYPQRTKPIRRP